MKESQALNRLSKAVTLTALGAMAVGVAIPALSDANAPAPAAATDITVHTHATAVKIIHSKPGDRGRRLRTRRRHGHLLSCGDANVA